MQFYKYEWAHIRMYTQICRLTLLMNLHRLCAKSTIHKNVK